MLHFHIVIFLGLTSIIWFLFTYKSYLRRQKQKSELTEKHKIMSFFLLVGH